MKEFNNCYFLVISSCFLFFWKKISQLVFNNFFAVFHVFKKEKEEARARWILGYPKKKISLSFFVDLGILPIYARS